MGVFRRAVSFMAGAVFGVYLAQNYDVPNVKKLSSTALLHAKHIEESHPKPIKKNDDD